MTTYKQQPTSRYRPSMPLKDWDYSSKAHYYITTVTYNRQLLFGEAVDDDVVLSPAGQLVCDQWLASANFHPYMVLHDFVVMPNHLHAIVEIVSSGGSPLGKLMNSFKSNSARLVNKLRLIEGVPVWHYDYYDHVVRDEQDLIRIQEYIANNPVKWAEDKENPAAVLPAVVMRGHWSET